MQLAESRINDFGKGDGFKPMGGNKIRLCLETGHIEYHHEFNRVSKACGFTACFRQKTNAASQKVYCLSSQATSQKSALQRHVCSS